MAQSKAGTTRGRTAAQERRERGRAEMRAQILDAAREIVQAEGIGALSMRGVARAIGYAPASLYEYFASREEICKALFFEGASGLGARMQEVLAALPVDAQPEDALRVMGHAYRGHALANAELFRFVFGNPLAELSDDDDVVGGGSDAFAILVEAASRGVESGALIATDPGAIAIAAWSIVHGFVMLEINGMLGGPAHCAPDGTPIDADALFDASLAMLCYGFVRR